MSNEGGFKSKVFIVLSFTLWTWQGPVQGACAGSFRGARGGDRTAGDTSGSVALVQYRPDREADPLVGAAPRWARGPLAESSVVLHTTRSRSSGGRYRH